MTLLKKSFPPSKTLGVRGVATVDVPFGSLLTTFFDTSLSLKWVSDLHSFEEHDVNRKTHNGILRQLYRVAGGVVVTDREFLLKRAVKKSKGRRLVTVRYTSFEDEERFPVAPGAVRSWSDETVWRFTKVDERRTKIDVLARLDPRGSLSPLLVNFIQRTWPKTSISRLAKLAKKRNKDSGEFKDWT